MPAVVFHKLVSIDEAIRIVIDKTKPSPKGVEIVGLDSAHQRVLAENIYSPIDHPPFDRSEVDGYAVRSIDISSASETNPVRLKISGFVKPGDSAHGLRCNENAVKISTGSVIPLDCDSVVMTEYTEEEDTLVGVYRPTAPGENISTTGSDISRGDLVLPRGVLLRHEHIALLAGLGISRVPVYVKPRAIVFSTGNEITEPGGELQLGKIYDANGFLITSYLRELGVEAHYGGVIPDDYSEIHRAVKNAVVNYDMVFTSGGTSAGETDIVYRVFGDLGEILVHGLKSKPGKPTVIAYSNNKLLFGLPGFTLSCYMILVRVVKPIVTKISGLRYVENRLKARIPFKIRKGLGKSWLIPSVIVDTDRGPVAYPVSLSSGSLYAISYSDGFIEIGEDLDVIEADTELDFYLFNERKQQRKLTIIGSNDPLLERIIADSGLIHSSRVLNIGSMGGWHAIMRGEGDIAPTHLLDPDTLKYNTPYLAKFGLRDKAVIIRGYERLVGFIVAKGNPRGINSFHDLIRNDVKIVNRPKGSGIRTLLDYNLGKIAREHGINPGELHRLVKGYTYEVKTHTAVAHAVKHGKADVGLACGYVAELYDLDFIPLVWEEYDFLLPKERLNKPEVRGFIKLLKSIELNDFMFAKYYRIPKDIGEPRRDQ